MSVRLGVIGVGAAGRVHVRNAIRIAGVELAAVAGTTRERAHRVAECAGDGTRACTPQEITRSPDIDAVVLATPPSTHVDLAIAALESGKHVLIEKPAALTASEGERLRHAGACQPGLLVAVGYMRRYDPLFTDLAAACEQGAVGDVWAVHLVSREVFPPEGGHKDPEELVLDVGVHDFDAACWLLDREAVEVFATAQPALYPGLAYDTTFVTLRFPADRVATVELSRASVVGHDIRCRVVGTKGMLEIGGGGTSSSVRHLSDRVSGDFAQGFEERWDYAFRAELESFRDACLGRSAFSAGLREDQRAVASALATVESLRSRGPCDVSPWAGNKPQ